MEEEPYVHPDFLPDDVGTVGRMAFEEIFVGAPPSWEPATPIWAVIAVGLVVLIAYAVYRRVVAYRANAYRRAALAELGALRSHAGDKKTAAAKVPALLKRCAIAAYGRESVASATGDAWRTFLDAHADGGGFVDGPGAVISTLVVRGPDAIDASDVEPLFDAADRFIRGHRA